MAGYSKTDKALVERAARHLTDLAQAERLKHGADWTANPEAKAAKLRYDRLRRDEMELRDLGKRFVADEPNVPVLQAAPDPVGDVRRALADGYPGSGSDLASDVFAALEPIERKRFLEKWTERAAPQRAD